jgi:hypothetical protein
VWRSGSLTSFKCLHERVADEKFITRHLYIRPTYVHPSSSPRPPPPPLTWEHQEVGGSSAAAGSHRGTLRHRLRASTPVLIKPGPGSVFRGRTLFPPTLVLAISRRRFRPLKKSTPARQPSESKFRPCTINHGKPLGLGEASEFVFSDLLCAGEGLRGEEVASTLGVRVERRRLVHVGGLCSQTEAGAAEFCERDRGSRASKIAPPRRLGKFPQRAAALSRVGDRGCRHERVMINKGWGYTRFGARWIAPSWRADKFSPAKRLHSLE